MSKFRAVIITGRLVGETRKGPVRNERCNSYDDLARLESLYSPYRGSIVEEGAYQFSGDVDDVFDD
jgi:hypothetical protein